MVHWYDGTTITGHCRERQEILLDLNFLDSVLAKVVWLSDHISEGFHAMPHYPCVP